MNILDRLTMRIPVFVACLVVAVQTGCTSALTASYLREGLWDTAEHAATEKAAADSDAGSDADSGSDADADDTRGPDAAVATDREPPMATPAPATDRERREAALTEAMARLSRLGSLDAATEAALVATLQRTQPEDWPVVVDEFAISLSAATPRVPSATATSAPPLDEAPDGAAAPEPAAVPAKITAAAADESPAKAPATPAAPAIDAAAAATGADPVAAPPLAVRTACFASAVRAWGDVDRFAADRFRPGEEVIVYLELDEVTAGSSPAGHTTCVDTVLRLVDGAGATLHTWRFDPVAETCGTRRRDYFARYVVRFPETVPAGTCRVEAAVTDTLAGATATAALPLEIVAAD